MRDDTVHVSQNKFAIAAVVVAIVVAAIASLVRRDHPRVPTRNLQSRASLSSAERERLRAEILAGNRRLAEAPLDAPIASTAAGPHASRPAPPAHDAAVPAHLEPMFQGDTPTLLDYRTRTFDIAGAIVDDCMAQTTDGGTRFEAQYVIIADDQAGGLFERVTFPPETNNSGPDTIECVTEHMLGATLPAPPNDIDRFRFAVQIIVTLDDAGARD
jgi:hypothetical protein